MNSMPQTSNEYWEGVAQRQVTDFILGGSNNGWDYWVNSEGVTINECLGGQQ